MLNTYDNFTLLQQMYIDLGFVTKFKIEVSQFITSLNTLPEMLNVHRSRLCNKV